MQVCCAGFRGLPFIMQVGFRGLPFIMQVFIMQALEGYQINLNWLGSFAPNVECNELIIWR